MTEIFHSLSAFSFDANQYVTLGAFDGIHAGHREIIDRVTEAARSNHGKSVLITFDPHPQELLQKGPEPFFLLTTLQEKLQVLKSSGLDKILVIPFTRDFSELSAETFVEDILVRTVGLKKIWIGYDHGFGKNRSGGLDLLRRFGLLYAFDVEHVEAQNAGEVVVSSTKIREAIRSGDVQHAGEMLGYPYSVHGLVSRGEGVGRTIGFPTANIFVENPKKLIPASGVYIVDLQMDKETIPGVCNIGFRPTFEGNDQRIEVHLLNFDQDIYGVPVCVRFHQRIRNEEKFSSVEQLIHQIRQDSTVAAAWWKAAGRLTES